MDSGLSSGLDPRRPLVLVAPGKGGPRVVAVNLAARQGGLVVGDLLSNARSKVLDLQAHAADPAADAAALRQLGLWAMRYAPVVAPWDEANGADGLSIDISGAAHLHGGEEALLVDLDRRLSAFGLAPRLAIAGTPGAAWALARHGITKGRAPGIIIAPGTEAGALRPLPLAALRLPEATLSLLQRLGLRRIGDVIDAPRPPLAARFDALLLRLDQALGRTLEPLVPAVAAPVYRAQTTFMEPIVSNEHVVEAATRLLQGLTVDLAHAGVGARVLRLMLFRVDGETQAVELGLAAPSRDPRHVARLIGLRLDRLAKAPAGLEADLGFEAAAIDVLVAEPLRASQARLKMGVGTAPPEALAQLIDRLQHRLGREAVRRLYPHQSHIPERAVRMGAPSPSASPRATSTSPRIPPARGEGRERLRHAAPHQNDDGLPRRMSGHQARGNHMLCVASVAAPRLLPAHPQQTPQPDPQWIAGRPRPLLLLPRPEPAEVLALIPDGPPRQFHWRGVLHHVSCAQGPERIAPEWWRQHPGDVERDYYVVEDSAGRRFWLYRAGLYERGTAIPQWFVHGVFG
ncbi:MAG TPA: DNA polymerase Y family protein [Hyphomicrobiaceae bacterium]|nr:DNA polymerase Y family protein [Hyphomicrobiaceae bacterium]